MLDESYIFHLLIYYEKMFSKVFKKKKKKYDDKKKNYLGILNHIVPHIFNNNIFTLFISTYMKIKKHTYSNNMHMIAFIYFYFELKGYSFYS
jgi:hypothetical protein